jgi:hypothetical protein
MSQVKLGTQKRYECDLCHLTTGLLELRAHVPENWLRVQIKSQNWDGRWQGFCFACPECSPKIQQLIKRDFQ